MGPDGTERWIGLALLVPDSQPSMQSSCKIQQDAVRIERLQPALQRHGMSISVVHVRLSDQKSILS